MKLVDDDPKLTNNRDLELYDQLVLGFNDHVNNVIHPSIGLPLEFLLLYA